MPRKLLVSLSLAIALILIFAAVYANLKPAKEESPMATTNMTRPPLDVAAPALTETATFALG